MRSLQSNSLALIPVKGEVLVRLGTLRQYQGRQVTLRDTRADVLEDLQQTAITQGTEASNEIEGDSVASDRVRAIVLQRDPPTTRSEEILAGYREALAWIHKYHEQILLTPDTILELHRRLFQYTDTPGGSYRTRPADIVRKESGSEAGVTVYVASPPDLVASQIAALCQEYTRLSKDSETDSFLLMSACVFDFTCIHPFDDGNGRVSRLLHTLLSYKAGFDLVRYISLEKGIYETKENYYYALTESSRLWQRGEHNWSPWLTYVTYLYVKTYERLFQQIDEMSQQGAKSERIRKAIASLPTNFYKRDLVAACPQASLPLIDRVLSEYKQKKVIQTVGMGRNAHYLKLVGDMQLPMAHAKRDKAPPPGNLKAATSDDQAKA